jgi:integrase/recombinase XerD
MARTSNPSQAGKTLTTLLAHHLVALEVKSYSEYTIRNRQVHIRMFIRWCKEQHINSPSQITRSVLQRYQLYLFEYRKRNGHPLSPASRFARLVPLRVWFRWMKREHIIRNDPSLDLELPRLGRPLPRSILSPREAELVMRQPDRRKSLGLRDRCILEVMYSTGLRRLEIVRLQLNDLQLERGLVLVRNGKGNRDRYAPLTNRGLRWVRRYLRSARPQLAKPDSGQTVFLTREGQPISRDHLTHIARHYIAMAKLNKTGACHVFRHTVATLMHENGADIRFVQQFLGHADIKTTQIYTQVAIRTLQRVHAATHPAP